jgi:hypothetical protein
MAQEKSIYTKLLASATDEGRSRPKSDFSEVRPRPKSDFSEGEPRPNSDFSEGEPRPNSDFSEDRPLASGNESNRGSDNSGIIENSKTYNTISCPCSTYVIKDSNFNIGCEREYGGAKQYFNPAKRYNHYINGGAPTLGDKWLCEDHSCHQSGFIFDGYYIVSVEENMDAVKGTSSVNSRAFTGNCAMPKTTFFSDYTTLVSPARIELMKELTIGTVRDIPIFEQPEGQASDIYKDLNPGVDFIRYDYNNVIGWAPSNIFLENKAIKLCRLGRHDLLDRNIDHDSSSLWNNKYIPQKITVEAGVLQLRMNGFNNPHFSITLKDSSGRSILKNPLNNISIGSSGEYILNQVIPKIKKGRSIETYDLVITPVADVDFFYAEGIHKGIIIRERLYQFKDPTIYITHDESTLANATTTSPFNSSKTGRVNSNDNSEIVHSFSVSHPSKIYFTNPLEVVRRSDEIVKIAKMPVGVKPSPSYSFIINDDGSGGDVEIGMSLSATVRYDKEILKILELEQVPDYDCIEAVETHSILTNKFEVDNTADLFEGMIVTVGDFESRIVSIDCEQGITIADMYSAFLGEVFTFTHKQYSKVSNLTRQSTGVEVTLSRAITIPNGTELIFRGLNSSRAIVKTKYSTSGSSEITITVTLCGLSFGQEDLTYTINTDDFITIKPPARDLYFNVGKDTSDNYLTIIGNETFNASDLVVKVNNVTTSAKPYISKNGTLTTQRDNRDGSIHLYKTYTPNPGFTGVDKISYVINDGTTDSDEKNIFITIQ